MEVSHRTLNDSHKKTNMTRLVNSMKNRRNVLSPPSGQ